MNRISVTAAVLGIAAFFFCACSFNNPSISLPKIQRIYAKSANGNIVEHLAVFVVFDDADGRNDYNELRLSENKTHLEWVLSREDTVFLQETHHSETQQWIGSRQFSYPRRTFPAGKYTLLVSDLSGNTSEIPFTLAEPHPFTTEPFSFSLTDSEWIITIKQPDRCSTFSLIALGSDLQPLAIQEIPSFTELEKKGTLEIIKELSGNTRYIQCLGETSDGSHSFLSGAFLLP